MGKDKINDKGQEAKQKSDVLLRLPQVLHIIPVSASTWWAGCREGRFPQPVHLSKRVTAWRESDIQRLIAGENNIDS